LSFSVVFSKFLFSFSFLCNGSLYAYSLTLILESSELSPMTIIFSFLIDGSNIALDVKLFLLTTLMEFLLGYLDTGAYLFPCCFPVASFSLVYFYLCLIVGLIEPTL
jgi:hypothetical protein